CRTLVVLAAVAVMTGLVSPARAQYCSTTVTFCSGADNEWITRVLFAGIDNSSPGDDGQPCYTDYTSVAGSVMPGNTYPFVFEYSHPTSLDTATVWIDWNRDQDFEDANEAYVLVKDGSTFASPIAVPSDAFSGVTRMRVRIAYNAIPNFCGANSY